MYADVLVLCGVSKEDLRAMVGRVVEVCRRGLKVNADKRKVMMLGGEEKLECEICLDWSKCQSSSIWGEFWMN